jgi:protein-tyrosine phosphatase
MSVAMKTREDAPVKIKAAPTFRDLGGIATSDGRQVRHGLFYRAGILLEPDAADVATIRSLGLRRVMDLRSEAERSHRPGTWASYGDTREDISDVNTDIRSGSAALLHLLEADSHEAGALEMMCATYRLMPQGFAGQLAKLFDALQEDDGTPLLIHCTAGKDRTGFACAMVLHALGVAEADIYADYLKTGNVLVGGPLAESTNRMLAGYLGHPLEADGLAVIMDVRREFLDVAITAVRAEFGNLERYLEEVGGLSAPRRTRLRQRLLA